jgi:hypothetical protein
MNSKLYYKAYKFLKIRASKGNPFKVLEGVTKQEKEKILKFLSYNHQVKFI